MSVPLFDSEVVKGSVFCKRSIGSLFGGSKLKLNLDQFSCLSQFPKLQFFFQLKSLFFLDAIKSFNYCDSFCPDNPSIWSFQSLNNAINRFDLNISPFSFEFALLYGVVKSVKFYFNL